MTEYEMADLVNTGVANMLAGQALYFTQLGSYLIVAWWIGSKLTRFQVTFLNALLILLTFTGMSAFAAMLGKNLALVNELGDTGSITSVASNTQTEVAVTAFIVFRILVLLAALVFMWQVRHPKEKCSPVDTGIG